MVHVYFPWYVLPSYFPAVGWSASWWAVCSRLHLLSCECFLLSSGCSLILVCSCCTATPSPNAQADSHKNYLTAIETTLQAALCLRNFPSQVVERHNKPEVEAQMSKEVILQPLVIARDQDQKCMIEPSINSIRVSIKIKQSDALEKVRSWSPCCLRVRRPLPLPLTRRVVVPRTNGLDY